VLSSGANQWSGRANNLAIKRETFERDGPFGFDRAGSEMALVRRVSEARPAGAVRFLASARVRRPSITGVLTWLRDKGTIGCRPTLTARSAVGTFRDSLHAQRVVFQATAFRGGLSAREMTRLVTLLALGSACNLLGRVVSVGMGTTGSRPPRPAPRGVSTDSA
jgi:hypothetical protein